MSARSKPRGIHKLARSFYVAGRGFIWASQERNMRIHLTILVIVLGFGMLCNLQPLEWVLITIVSAMVITAELFNTALEEFADVVRDDQGWSYHVTTKLRDISAAAVLVSAICAAIVGIAIFIPYIRTILF